MEEHNKGVQEFRYVIDVEQVYKGPRVLAFLTKWGLQYGTGSIIYLVVMAITKLLTGKTVEEENYIVIYKKFPGLMGKKIKMYEEKISTNVKEHTVSRNMYHLEKAAEKGELSGTLELLLSGQKKIFEEE